MSRLLAVSALALVTFCSSLLAAGTGQIIELAGQTMGTTYSVKFFSTEDRAESIDRETLTFDIDAELRNVNDQMSTYLKSSEISRFNASDSTDWFDVSPEFAAVVAASQAIAAETDGAFDITVGPLVNVWNFGPEPRTGKAPAAETVASLLDQVGYQKLSVRTDPPAIKKSVPDLQIDLSAIAKGHGVDRVVELLNEKGHADVFVEIGGEVRVSGSKAGQWWKVGIQMPDAATQQITVAHSLNTGDNDVAMATSGDYRNFFEDGGRRYSHTIDPRFGMPVEHTLASVSIIADNCMMADAWATAINVLGPEAGLAMANQQGISALLITRTGGAGDTASYVKTATGLLQKYASDAEVPVVANAAGKPANWAVLGITVVAFASVLFAMAVGVMFGRKSISGSCGGIANKTNEDGSVACGLCSNPADACKDLRSRMQAEQKA